MTSRKGGNPKIYENPSWRIMQNKVNLCLFCWIYSGYRMWLCLAQDTQLWLSGVISTAAAKKPSIDREPCTHQDSVARRKYTFYIPLLMLSQSSIIVLGVLRHTSSGTYREGERERMNMIRKLFLPNNTAQGVLGDHTRLPHRRQSQWCACLLQHGALFACVFASRPLRSCKLAHHPLGHHLLPGAWFWTED